MCMKMSERFKISKKGGTKKDVVRDKGLGIDPVLVEDGTY